MIIMESVAIKGATFHVLITNPLNIPQKIPIRSPMSITAIKGKAISLLDTLHATTELKAITDPTERSIPPVMITNVIPAATIPTMEVCLKRFIRFLEDKNAGEAIASTMSKQMKAIYIPYWERY